MRWKKPKYHAVRCEQDGIKFDSKMEREYYQLLKSDPSVMHIDIHTSLCIGLNTKLNVDFIVWRHGQEVEVHEVKGVETQDFKLKRKLFDANHPLAPMIVVTKKKNKWEYI